MVRNQYTELSLPSIAREEHHTMSPPHDRENGSRPAGFPTEQVKDVLNVAATLELPGKVHASAASVMVVTEPKVITRRTNRDRQRPITH